ncbi:ComG operon protein 1 [Apilactobacillus kunkeei]|nr:ComG operon protein 1 [Apilactobacillus kunkeei]CAI2587256.1 ComG operon protein 1 [Apilactobacillus kunkeei]CAI2801910.1 ComG operon protein 1 [Apilactobacillus kunkeei]
MSISSYFDSLINQAIKEKIKDIYLLPINENYIVREHTGIKILNRDYIDYEKANKLINYCKYIGGMSISERRRPQMGSFEFVSNDDKFFLRFSSVGNYKNLESMVIRIIYSLDDETINYDDESQFYRLVDLSKKNGMIIFAGKTGSGKTTSIYHLANSMSDNKLIMSIEDPVEVINNKFLQLQVNDSADMGYDELIKVGLRNRPDVFIIGEIRDASTAQAAVKAALSGHLVLTTIHARDIDGVINRLGQLGCDYADLFNCLNSVVFQKLSIKNEDELSVRMDIKNDFNDLRERIIGNGKAFVK